MNFQRCCSGIVISFFLCTFFLSCLFNIPMILIFSKPVAIDCSHNYTYSGYVQNIHSEKNYSNVYFLIFKRDKIVEHNWEHSFKKVPVDILEAYKTHNIVHLYKDCNKANSNFSFHIFHYKSYYLLVICSLANVCFLTISACISVSCVGIFGVEENKQIIQFLIRKIKPKEKIVPVFQTEKNIQYV